MKNSWAVTPEIPQKKKSNYLEKYVEVQKEQRVPPIAFTKSSFRVGKKNESLTTGSIFIIQLLYLSGKEVLKITPPGNSCIKEGTWRT